MTAAALTVYVIRYRDKIMGQIPATDAASALARFTAAFPQGHFPDGALTARALKKSHDSLTAKD